MVLHEISMSLPAPSEQRQASVKVFREPRRAGVTRRGVVGQRVYLRALGPPGSCACTAPGLPCDTPACRTGLRLLPGRDELLSVGPSYTGWPSLDLAGLALVRVACRESMAGFPLPSAWHDMAWRPARFLFLSNALPVMLSTASLSTMRDGLLPQ